MPGGMKVLVLGVASVLALGLGSCGKDEESLPVGSPPIVPNWAEEQGFAGNKEAERGAEIFAQAGCLQCHTYLGAGASNLGAPDLTEIGKQSPRSVEAYANYVSDPSRFGNTVMPKFEDLGRRNLLFLGAFLQASKGER
jgi:mono/diheme cytochrome c family protein